MEYKNSLRWIACATIVSLVTVLALYVFESEPGFLGIPISKILVTIMTSAIIGLVVNEFYNANQYRILNRLSCQLLELDNPPFTENLYRRLSEEERDDLIKNLVTLSDRKWNKFLKFCEDIHPYRFSEFDQDIIKDIEMLRALK